MERAKQKILVDNVYYCFQNNSVEVRQIEEVKRLSTLFISYTECDTPIVDIIEDKIREKLQDKIKISRYTGLKYKDSFKEFMDTIQEHDYVLTVVSDTYLKRQACMYEVGEIIKDHHYKDKLLFITFDMEYSQTCLIGDTSITINDVKNIIAVAAGMFIGAHIVFAFTNLPQIIDLFSKIGSISFSDFFTALGAYVGGMVFYGGFFGAVAAVAIYSRFSKVVARQDAMDLLSVCVPLFHVFGRVGCFLTGCCYGVVSDFGFPLYGINRFPVQLVEALGNLAIFFVIMTSCYHNSSYTT